ncbi:MAG: adenosylcobinamide amidohydrolase [Deltaproteobacteria bacterium]|nr:adenosylcobinamide amidohydrolase [Deltaproteobacteria bacterium]
MTKFLTYIAVFLLLLPSWAGAAGIAIPDNVQAKASFIRSAQDGLWEKTLVIRFPERRRLLSTKDGFVQVFAAVNHAAHPLLWERVSETMKTATEDGSKVYEAKTEERIAWALQLRRGEIALMATAADMDNLAVVTLSFSPITVTVLATAGAKSNALRAGVDEGSYIEVDPGAGQARNGLPGHGTVNIVILTNARLTDGAMARTIITGTEAKTAAFEDLRVPSSYTKGVQATGTGTDSMMVVSGATGPKVTYTGGHSKIGELIGKTVYQAVVEALGKQNGFSKTKNAIHPDSVVSSVEQEVK